MEDQAGTAPLGVQIKPAPEPVTETPKAETDDDVLKEARERYKACADAEGDNRKDALDDLRFLSGGINQWDLKDAQMRSAQGRPCLTINNLPTFLHQVTNDQRKNKPGIKVDPVDDDADVETAKVEQGLIRHIEYNSNAGVAYNTAVNSAAAIGFGFFRFVTGYESESSFDQKIMFKRIRNALSVHIDPLSQEADGADMGYAFIDSLELRAEFKRQYPNANANSTNLIGQNSYAGWVTQETVLICEYYRIKEIADTLCMYVDGTTGWKSMNSTLAVAIGKDGKPMERASHRRKVEWFKITGADVLERTEIMCRWIPVFPVYGDEIDIEGKVIRSGIIRNSKDSFKAYNYWISCATEEVALRPKSPFIMAEGQDEGHEYEWANANRLPLSSLKYKPTTVDGQLAPPPQRQAPADIPSGMLAMAMHAADNKKATTGLFDSSLGARGSATSGVQERAQQQQGDTANFHYSDNLNITVAHAGRCLVDMIPHYYDGARTVRILGDDDKADQKRINEPMERTNPKTGAVETVMHDLTVGTYDVVVKAGPSYDTRRQEAADFLTSAMQSAKDPASGAVITYLAFKNQDLAGADDATKMLKKLLPPGVAEPEEGQEPVVPTPHGPMPISKVGPAMEQLGTALQNADQQLQEANAVKAEADRLAETNKARELEIKNHDSDTKAFEAATKRTEMENAHQAEMEKLAIQRTAAEAELIKNQCELQKCLNEAGEGNKLAAMTPKELADLVVAAANNPPASPTPEQVAEIIHGRLKAGMKIKAPSGSEYEVALGG